VQQIVLSLKFSSDSTQKRPILRERRVTKKRIPPQSERPVRDNTEMINQRLKETVAYIAHTLRHFIHVTDVLNSVMMHLIILS